MYLMLFNELIQAIDNKPENLKSYDESLEVVFDTELTKDNPNIDFLEFLSDAKNDSIQRDETIDLLTKQLIKEFSEYDYHEIRDKFVPRYSLDLNI